MLETENFRDWFERISARLAERWSHKPEPFFINIMREANYYIGRDANIFSSSLFLPSLKYYVAFELAVSVWGQLDWPEEKIPHLIMSKPQLLHSSIKSPGIKLLRKGERGFDKVKFDQLKFVSMESFQKKL